MRPLAKGATSGLGVVQPSSGVTQLPRGSGGQQAKWDRGQTHSASPQKPQPQRGLHQLRGEYWGEASARGTLDAPSVAVLARVCMELREAAVSMPSPGQRQELPALPASRCSQGCRGARAGCP